MREQAGFLCVLSVGSQVGAQCVVCTDPTLAVLKTASSRYRVLFLRSILTKLYLASVGEDLSTLMDLKP